MKGVFLSYKILPMMAGSWLIVAGAEGQAPIWSDEFDQVGAPNEAYWSYDLGDGGWGNNEIQTYTNDSANVRVEGGYLYITAQEQQLKGKRRSYTSARIKTQEKLTVRYGTIEARIKVPNLADGLWPAFWTLGRDFPEVGWPACGELDVMEMGSQSAIAEGLVNRRVGSTAHWEHGGGYAGYGLTLDAATDLNNDFHVFRMEWTPDFVSTYLDGQQIWVIDISPGACTDCTEFHQPHFIILNMAVGGSYTGLFNYRDITATFPAEMLVDWVRIYDNGFTELSGSAIPGTEAHVEAINVGVSGRKRVRGTADVQVRDEKGDAVAGADVTVQFSGSFNETVTATTGGDGWAAFTTSGRVKSPGFQVCVTDLVHPSMAYVPVDNAEECANF